MVSCVLVDDESIDLEGLKLCIPWQELGIEVLLASNRPAAALEFIEKHEVDLLITDVKMPVISGIELAKSCRRGSPDLKVIFISGYDDFTLAKQAISLMAVDYVLKPVDDDELIATLRKTVVQIEQEKEKQKKELWLEESFQWYQSNVVSDLLEGHYDPKRLAALFEDETLASRRWAAGLIEVDELLWKVQAGGGDPETEPRSLLGKVYEGYMAHAWGFACKVAPNQIGFITHLDEAKAPQALQELIRSLKEQAAISLTIALGGFVDGMDLLSESFREARELLNYKLFDGKGKVYTREAYRAKEDVARESNDLTDVLDEMFAAMSSYELIRIDDCLKELFQLFRGLRNTISIYHFAVHVITRLDNYLQSIHESLTSLIGWEIVGLDVIYRFETVEELHRWLRYQLFHVSELLLNKRRNRNQGLFEQIDAYMEEHMASDITLKELANHFGYSTNHLGVLFKEYYGNGFTETMITKRLEKAKVLLKNPKLKIYEVADQLGYRSIAYFSKQFKNYSGFTPGEFRG
ncbi:response regulator [Paenibacillus athensensis]|nr:response regulator [Paenibacillus athensensis]MCD1260065.1 response regulator [Paenibacillus athensensis]